MVRSRTPKLRGGRGGRPGRPQTQIGKMLQDWHQDYSSDNVDFASLGASGDVDVTMIDNSVDFSNSILKWSKLTLRRVWEPEDLTVLEFRLLATALLKEDQDDSGNTYDLSDEETIRELRRDKKLVRGSWLTTAPRIVTDGFSPAMAVMMKPIVLRNFVMDREEDLVFAYTNLGTAYGATSQILRHFTQGWVRVLR